VDGQHTPTKDILAHTRPSKDISILDMRIAGQVWSALLLIVLHTGVHGMRAMIVEIALLVSQK
jgi:hypothetical protein